MFMDNTRLEIEDIKQVAYPLERSVKEVLKQKGFEEELHAHPAGMQSLTTFKNKSDQTIVTLTIKKGSDGKVVLRLEAETLDLRAILTESILHAVQWLSSALLRNLPGIKIEESVLEDFVTYLNGMFQKMGLELEAKG